MNKYFELKNLIILYELKFKKLKEKTNEEYDAQLSDAKYTAEEGFGLCGQFLIVLSYLLLLIGMPFTLCCCLKVFKEGFKDIFFLKYFIILRLFKSINELLYFDLVEFYLAVLKGQVYSFYYLALIIL